MRTNIVIDDKLMAEALRATGLVSVLLLCAHCGSDAGTSTVDLTDHYTGQKAQAVAVLRENFQVCDASFDLDNATYVADRLYRLGCAQIFRTTPAKDHGLLDPALRSFVRPVMELATDDYIDLMRRRDALGAQLAALFQSFDVLVLPTVPILAFEAGRNAPADQGSDDWMAWNPFTPAFNLLHVPALSVPLWPRGSGLPVGLQLVARFGADDVLVALAHWIEAHPSGLFARGG